METADNCRRAAREAVADVEPPQLHDLVESVLDGASMVPGALTVTSAAIAASGGAGTAGAGTGTGADADGSRSSATERYAAALEDEPAESDADELVTHAAGVQLIYEGLRLTRTLAHEEPWRGIEDDEADPQSRPDQDAIESDLEILAADILVSRGFYLLARTDAADKAVRTVQAFGRDQTRRDEVAADGSGDPAAIDANLERDILELAVETGAAAVGRSPPTRLLALADDLAADVGTAFPPAAECLTDLEPSLGEEPFDDRPLEFEDRSLEDGPTDRATSATDP